MPSARSSLSGAGRPAAAKKAGYPPDILPSLRGVDFVCPICRGELAIDQNGYRCAACERNYPLHAGIPDFRVFPDPYLDFNQDFDRTEIVLAGLTKYCLEELLEYYWSFSDITPAALRSVFIRSALLGGERARHTVERFGDGTFKAEIAPRTVLEIGSGTGNFLVAANEKYDRVIGIDIAMRWLHVSRRRFMDHGLPEPALVCCCAEFLPFADNSFDLVTSTSTLEFVNDQQAAISECSRVVTDSGSVHISTVNRFSLAADPYAHLWGVGFLPRGWQARYVRRRNGSTYRAKTLSYGELLRIADRSFSYRETALPDVDSSILEKLPPAARLKVHVYRFLKSVPGFNLLLKYFGPGWDIILQKKSNGSGINNK